MSLWVHDSNKQIIEITENGGVSRGNTTDVFYCPSCGNVMTFVSEASNRRTAHFQGHHIMGCDIGYTDPSENVNNYTFEEYSLKDFLDKLKSEGIRTTPPTNTTISSENNKDINSSDRVQDTKTKRTLPIKTVRQLFSVLANSNPSEIIYGNTTVRDIYCGRSTAYFYTRFIGGIHLVYAQLRRYDKDNCSLFFQYPSESRKQIEVVVRYKVSLLFDSFINKHHAHIHHFYIIFAEFNQSKCLIDSATQIIYLGE